MATCTDLLKETQSTTETFIGPGALPEASHTDVCSFSWLLLNGELVEWLKVWRQLDTDRLSGAAFHFLKCDKTLCP